MAKKKYSEPGLNYVIELRMKPAKTQMALQSQLYDAAAPKLVNTLLEKMQDIWENKNNYKELYQAKETNFDLSLALDSAFYADFFRKTCNWINDNKELFHGEILEVGCGCGIIACFIARLFPQLTITALDRCQEAITNAIKLAHKLNVSNIKFICADITDFPEQYLFDVVYSSRTLAENIKRDYENQVLDLDEIALLASNNLVDYAESITKHLKPNGTLISVVKSNINSFFLGWLLALHANEFTPDLKHYKQIISTEISDDCKYQFFTSSKEPQNQIEPLNFFAHAFEKYNDARQPLYYGDDAKVMLFFKGGEIIEGYEVFDNYGNLISRIACFTHRFDETAMFFYQSVGCNSQIQCHDIGEKEEFLLQISKEIAKYKAAGLTVKELKEDYSTLESILEQQEKAKKSAPQEPIYKTSRNIVFPQH